MTECGRAVEDVASVIDVEQLKWRLRQWGQQRTAFTVCITCMNTAKDAPRWDTRPVGMLARDYRRGHALVYRDYDRNTGQYGPVLVDQLGAELHAIAGLIEAHREEFDQRVESAKQAALFAARRSAAERSKQKATTDMRPVAPIRNPPEG
jgi:hypothetical protein